MRKKKIIEKGKKDTKEGMRDPQEKKKKSKKSKKPKKKKKRPCSTTTDYVVSISQEKRAPLGMSS